MRSGINPLNKITKHNKNGEYSEKRFILFLFLLTSLDKKSDF
jgi:hypothetical protein